MNWLRTLTSELSDLAGQLARRDYGRRSLANAFRQLLSYLS